MEEGEEGHDVDGGSASDVPRVQEGGIVEEGQVEAIPISSGCTPTRSTSHSPRHLLRSNVAEPVL